MKIDGILSEEVNEQASKTAMDDIQKYINKKNTVMLQACCLETWMSLAEDLNTLQWMLERYSKEGALIWKLLPDYLPDNYYQKDQSDCV